MTLFESGNCYESKNSSKALEKKLLETEKYLLLQPNFINFQNWSSQSNSLLLDDENWLNDEQLGDELTQLFGIDESLDDETLTDELARLEEYLMESKNVLVACPDNMPRWENAWWGERVLRQLN
jgi:hypothetical protein